MTTERLRLLEPTGSWEQVSRSDAVVRGLADRHYSRRSIGAAIVGGPGHVLVFRSHDDRAGWITLYTEYPDDELDAWRCTMFRNEGPALSSALIVEAMAATAELWGTPPRDGWVTYVDTAQVRSTNPGYCFLKAGWRRDPTYCPDRRGRSLVRLRAR